MPRRGRLFFSMAVPAALGFLTSLSFAQEQDSDSIGPVVAADWPSPVVSVTSGTDSEPIGWDEISGGDDLQRAAPEAVPANAGTVYFTPQDENTSVTCLFLYNTSASDATVDLDTFQLDGSPQIDTSISVPAGNLKRVCSDEVSPAVGTWTTAELVNFRTASTYGRLTLPRGVRVDGYVAWNGGTTYDPLASVQTLRLRFVQPLTTEVRVYFTPQDENTSVTCLFLYNTSASDATVDLDTFQLDGSPQIDTSISVPAGNLKRVCSDEVSPAVGTWTTAELVNFRTASTYGRLTLPPGVMAEGYVAWNGGSTYDPLASVPTLELRFDTNLIFLSGFATGDATEWSSTSP